MKKIMSAGLWPQVEVNSADNMKTMVRKVGEPYERQVPIFTKKVKFLELTRMKGEGYKEWMNKIDHQSELAHLEGIKAQYIQLMKFCQGLHNADRLYDKIMDVEVKSWASVREIIKNTQKAKHSKLTS